MARGKFYTVDGAEARFADSTELAVVDGKAAQAVTTSTDALAKVIRVQNETAALAGRVAALEGGGGGGAQTQVSAPTLVGYIGDSWMTQPTAGAGQGIDVVCTQHLGCAGLGGGSLASSWASGADRAFEAAARLDPILSAAPDMLVVVGSHIASNMINFGDATGDVLAQAVTTMVARVRAQCPATVILVVGPQPTTEYNSYAGAASKAALAIRRGVASAGGADNGVWHADWTGLAQTDNSPSPVKWTGPGRQWKAGELISYVGVVYRVRERWQPASDQTPDSATAPVDVVSTLMTGYDAGGTRAHYLARNKADLTPWGALSYGGALAAAVRAAWAASAPWRAAHGPATFSPAPAPTPSVKTADLRGTYWGQAWGPTTVAQLTATLRSAPQGVALSLRQTSDQQWVVSQAAGLSPKAGGAQVMINQTTLAACKAVETANGVIASLDEAITAINAQTPVNTSMLLAECTPTNGDGTAQYWDSNDDRLLAAIAAKFPGDAAARVWVITQAAQNPSRSRSKAKYPALKRLATVTSGVNIPTIKAIADADAIALEWSCSDDQWAAAATLGAPLWAHGVRSQNDATKARASAAKAGVKIRGWISVQSAGHTGATTSNDE